MRVVEDTCDQLQADLSAVIDQDPDQVLHLLQEAIAIMPECERSEGGSASDTVIRVLNEALERKALKVAASVYEEWRNEVWLPLSLRGAIMKMLSRYSNWKAASSQVRELLAQEELSFSDATELFNEILSGMIEANHPLTSFRTDVIIKDMLDIDVQPAAGTLRLIVEAKTQYAAPGFLIDLGQSILEIVRRFDTSLTSGTLLAISGAHLRTGDLDAAYRWFLASQLMEKRQTLDDAPTLDLVSQLARALAIGGRACQLKRLLSLTKEDGGQLPQDVMSVSLSGYSCGRSLATCWFEPPPEVLRRRGIWASTPSTEKQGVTEVTCAEQWDWREQETSRHEMYQWYPYLAPDTKLERAWLTPLRSFDRGSLGLSRQWAGQTPAEAAARERLQEAGIQSWDLDSAIALEPPRLGGKSRGSHGRPILLRPEPRTWRMHHADAVKKSFATLHRIRAGSPAELRDVLLAETNTRLMFGAKAVSHVIPHATIKEWVQKADSALIARLKEMKERDVKSLTDQKLIDLIIHLSDLSQQDIKIEEDPKLNLSQLRSILLIAIRFASGDFSMPLSGEEYVAKIMAMSDEDLEDAFQKLTTSINDQIMGAELTREVEAALVRERQEDSAEWSGSAREELELALEICACLKDLGIPRLSSADVRAMLRAAHTLGDQELAEKVLNVQDPDLGDEISNDLGPAGQALSETMIRGGWDAETSKEFLKGQRLIPLRDGNSALGQLQTRFLDPLQGLSSSDATSERLVSALTEPFEDKLTRFSRTLPKGATTAQNDLLGIDDGQLDEAVQWQVKVKVPLDPAEAGPKKYEWVTKEVVVSQNDVLEGMCLHPKSAETLLRMCNMPQRGKTSPSFVPGVTLLQEMGLPVPNQQDKKAQLLKFVLAVLHSQA